MKHVFYLLLFMICQDAFSQIYSFEDGSVPADWSATKGNLSVSADKYKLGSRSLRWDWVGGDKLKLTNLNSLKEVSTRVNGGITLWIYNTKYSTDDLTFSFIHISGVEKCTYKFKLNFTGWRCLWAGFMDDMGHDRTKLNAITVKAPAVSQGRVYFDYLEFVPKISWERIDDFQHAVKQPYNTIDNFLEKYRTDLITISDATTREKKDIGVIAQRIDRWFLSGEDKTVWNDEEYIKRKKSIDNWIDRANSSFDVSLSRDEENIVTGPGLFPQYSSSKIGNVSVIKFRDISEKYLIPFALDWRLNKSEIERQRLLDIYDWYNDQGWTAGSAMGSIRFEKLRSGGYFHSLFLMREQLGDVRLKRELNTLKWFTLFGDAISRNLENRHGESADNLRTLALPKLYYALMLPDDNDKVAALRVLTKYYTDAFSGAQGYLDTFKPDFTGYHHRGVYMSAYYPDALYMASLIYYLLHDTSFALPETVFSQLKNCLLAFRNIASIYDVPVATSGRFPTQTQKLDRIIAAYAYLSLSSDEPDMELSQAFMRLWNADPEIVSRMVTDVSTDITHKSTLGEIETCARLLHKSILPEEVKDTRVYYPYAGLLVNKSKNWHISIKGTSKYIWDFESSSTENLYGRYLSNGQIEYTRLDRFRKNNAYKDKNWDWNYIPGTTSKVLSLTSLNTNTGGNGKHRNFSDETFLGGTVCGTDVSVFSMKLHDNVYDKTFYADKTVFCVDSICVCIGSNIKNDDFSVPTVTTLFQQETNEGEKVMINGDEFVSAVTKILNPVIVDNMGTAYIVKNGTTVTERKGGVVRSYITHGEAPAGDKYIYYMVLNAGNNDISRYRDEATSPIVILRQDKSAHIIREKTRNIICYAVFDSEIPVNTGHVKTVNAPVIILLKEDEDSIDLSVCEPDMRRPSAENNDSLTEDKVSAEGTPFDFELTLDDVYTLEDGDPEVSIISSGDVSALKITTIDGKSYHAKLKKYLSGCKPENKDRIECVYDRSSQTVNFCSSNEDPFQIEIYSLRGDRLCAMEGLKGNYTKDISLFPDGFYMISVRSGSGYSTQKIIKY